MVLTDLIIPEMILKIATLKEGVAQYVEGVHDAEELDLEFVDFHYLKKIALEGSAERMKQTVTFRGMMTSRIKQICGRCLKHVESDLRIPFDLSYEIEGRETIDTTNDLRDILILGHPDRFLCDLQCRGICPCCAFNLNEGKCQCQNTSSSTPSWNSLKSWFKNREK